MSSDAKNKPVVRINRLRYYAVTFFQLVAATCKQKEGDAI